LPSQSYDFRESKEVRLMTDVSRLHCTLQTSHPVLSVNMEPEVEGKVDVT